MILKVSGSTDTFSPFAPWHRRTIPPYLGFVAEGFFRNSSLFSVLEK